MKIFFKFLHIVIVAIFVITGNDIYDYILGGIIAVIAYIYAFRFTGKMVSNLFYNSSLMSLVHWSIRTLVSIMMIAITKSIYSLLENTISLTSDYDSEFIAVAICVSGWLILAEFLKYKSRLKKSYWN